VVLLEHADCRRHEGAFCLNDPVPVNRNLAQSCHREPPAPFPPVAEPLGGSRETVALRGSVTGTNKGENRLSLLIPGAIFRRDIRMAPSTEKGAFIIKQLSISQVAEQ
jgi:hypothetical protein